jgi:hypothetical protein
VQLTDYVARSSFLFAILLLLQAGCRTASHRVLPDHFVRIEAPAERVVYQRNQQGLAMLAVAGKLQEGLARIEARLVPRQGTNFSNPTEWIYVASAGSDGTFSGSLRVPTGWYQLELRAVRNSRLVAKAIVSRVGVGEVFLVVGHSVAQGGEINLPGSNDDRVNVVSWSGSDDPNRQSYERTANPLYLPILRGTPYLTGTIPVPFGVGTYFWAKFGEEVARRFDVPVMIFNAGFGGTSLEHWAKSVRGEPFEHSFVNSKIQMPYTNVANTIQSYLKKTGVRAVLSDQGQNDWPAKNPEAVLENYKTWVAKMREDLNFPQLAVLVNRQTPPPNVGWVREMQEQLVAEDPFAFAGPDYDTLAPPDRPDGIHLSFSGAAKAATLWVDAIELCQFPSLRPFVPWERPQKR